MALKGVRICASDKDREFIYKHGGLYSSGVTSLTDYLVVKESELKPMLQFHVSRVNDARRLGVPLVTKQWLVDSVSKGYLLDCKQTDYNPDHFNCARMLILGFYQLVICLLLTRLFDLYRLRRVSRGKRSRYSYFSKQGPWPLSSFKHRLRILFLVALSDWVAIIFFVGVLIVAPYWSGVRPSLYLSVAAMLWLAAAFKLDYVKTEGFRRTWRKSEEHCWYMYLVSEALRSLMYGLAVVGTWFLSPGTAWPALTECVGLTSRRNYWEPSCFSSHFRDVRRTQLVTWLAKVLDWLRVPFVLFSFRGWRLCNEVFSSRFPATQRSQAWRTSAAALWKQVACDYAVGAFLIVLLAASNLPYLPTVFDMPWWGFVRWLARLWLVVTADAIYQWYTNPGPRPPYFMARRPEKYSTDVLVMSVQRLACLPTFVMSPESVAAVFRSTRNDNGTEAFYIHLAACKGNLRTMVRHPKQHLVSVFRTLDELVKPSIQFVERWLFKITETMVSLRRSPLLLLPPLLMVSAADDDALAPRDNELVALGSLLFFFGSFDDEPRLVIMLSCLFFSIFLYFLVYHVY